jgi:antitoxin component YwqK of YwqJK toxin-antitoxin module/predicted small lipoprotein YifL
MRKVSYTTLAVLTAMLIAGCGKKSPIAEGETDKSQVAVARNAEVRKQNDPKSSKKDEPARDDKFGEQPKQGADQKPKNKSVKEQPGNSTTNNSAPKDIPVPDFTKFRVEPPKVEFSPNIYAKGPNGEKIVTSGAPDVDPMALTADGPQVIGRHGIQGYNRKGDGKPVKHGAEIHFDLKNNKLSEWYWHNGEMHGSFKKWHPNGQLAVSCTYKEGKRHGFCEAWYENGKKKNEMVSIEGLGEGYFVDWYENGEKKREMVVKKDKGHGPYVKYFPNGNRSEQVEVKEGKYEGKQYRWHDNGNLASISTYGAGQIIAPVERWFKSGDPIVPFNWTKHTKTEFKAKLAENSIGGAIKPEFKVFQPIWIQEEYETVFGPPEDKHRFGVKQTWSYRCSDGTISFQVTADKGGSVIFSKILSE